MTAEFVRQLDAELNFEVVLAREASYGYNAQTRRFVDSRNGSWEVTPWMISQFPRGAKHIEEVVLNGRVLRTWSEVYDRNSGRLLSVSALGEPFASIALEENAAESTDSSDGSHLASSHEGLSDQAAAARIPLRSDAGEKPIDVHDLDSTGTAAISSTPTESPAIPRQVTGENVAETPDARTSSSLSVEFKLVVA